jgi:hypothetical protein
MQMMQFTLLCKGRANGERWRQVGGTRLAVETGKSSKTTQSPTCRLHAVLSKRKKKEAIARMRSMIFRLHLALPL